MGHCKMFLENFFTFSVDIRADFDPYTKHENFAAYHYLCQVPNPLNSRFSLIIFSQKHSSERREPDPCNWGRL
jgi:hypothetical protein